MAKTKTFRYTSAEKQFPKEFVHRGTYGSVLKGADLIVKQPSINISKPRNSAMCLENNDQENS